MKKFLIIAVCLVMAAASASAQGFGGGAFVMGPGVSYSLYNLEDGATWSFTSASLVLSSFSGEILGLYTIEQFGFIFSADSNGVAMNMNAYSMSLSVDCIFGIGFRMFLTDALSLIAGGGLYFGAAMMMPDDYMDDMFGGFMPMGPGVGVTASYDLFEGIGVGVQVGAAYSLFSPISILDDYVSGIHVFGGAGISLSY